MIHEVEPVEMRTRIAPALHQKIKVAAEESVRPIRRSPMQNTTTIRSWRYVLPVHPAADIFGADEISLGVFSTQDAALDTISEAAS